jgi:hypothetical protein
VKSGWPLQEVTPFVPQEQGMEATYPLHIARSVSGGWPPPLETRRKNYLPHCQMQVSGGLSSMGAVCPPPHKGGVGGTYPNPFMFPFFFLFFVILCFCNLFFFF